MKISVFKVRWNAELVKSFKKGDVVTPAVKERGSIVEVAPAVRAKEPYSIVEKSWPERTNVVAVESRDHLRASLEEYLEEGQSAHIRQIDELVHDVDLYLHVAPDEEEGDAKKDAKDGKTPPKGGTGQAQSGPITS